MYAATIMSEHSPAAVIGDALHRLLRQINRRKAALAADPQAAEWAAHQMLDVIYANGSMRAAYLAESTSTDPSTVSRHVAALVKSHLVERRPDPVDGRASLLACTPAGEAIVERIRARRLGDMERLLSAFTGEELQTLGELLGRFASYMEEQPIESAAQRQLSPVGAASEGHR
jgi:DNA-binding MarR family transcriptional regulator